MIRVVLIGTGNVSYHLCKAFEASNAVDIVQIYNRSLESFKDFPEHIPKTVLLDELMDADVYVVAISDKGIKEITYNLPFENKLVIHTSGSTGLKAIHSKNNAGVLYPLQTFSKSKTVDFSEVPIFIEAKNETDLKSVTALAEVLSKDIHIINSEQRRALHMAAVFTCNFVNHLYAIGHEICDANDLPFDVLKPLIQETTEKIQSLSPKEAQTGPAKRGDQKTIKKHIKSLENKDWKKIYKLLSKSIKETHEQKL